MPRRPDAQTWFIVSAPVGTDKAYLCMFTKRERESWARELELICQMGFFRPRNPSFVVCSHPLIRGLRLRQNAATRERKDSGERVGLIGVDNWIPLKSFRVKRLSTKAATIFGSASKLKRFPSSASTSKAQMPTKMIKAEFYRHCETQWQHGSKSPSWTIANSWISSIWAAA